MDRKTPGNRLSDLHPPNDGVINIHIPSMRTIWLRKGQSQHAVRKRAYLTNPARGKVDLAASHH